METQVGDKIRFKSGLHLGKRGVVTAAGAGQIAVRLDATGEIVEGLADSIRNFSCAARKAWESMPDRPVGRRKGTRLCDRVSVTLRIDRNVWEQFRAAETSGMISDRTATINRWLRQKLGELERGEL
jgi:uncharacterized protein (DUF4415 family)